MELVAAGFKNSQLPPKRGMYIKISTLEFNMRFSRAAVAE
jgi:hypothetical protein